jgi:NhaP-type Na+/H+ and K+/H+ antiporter
MSVFEVAAVRHLPTVLSRFSRGEDSGVALTLSLTNNEYKVTILTITYAVVIFSIVVQGLTVQPLVRKLMPVSNDEE